MNNINKTVTLNGNTFTNADELFEYLTQNEYSKVNNNLEVTFKLNNELNFKIKNIDINNYGDSLGINLEHSEFENLNSIYGYIGKDEMFDGGFKDINEFIETLNEYNKHSRDIVKKFSHGGVNIEPSNWIFGDIDNYNSINFSVENQGEFKYYFDDNTLDSVVDLLSGKVVIAEFCSTDATQEVFSEDTLLIDNISIMDLIHYGQKVEVKLINK